MQGQVRICKSCGHKCHCYQPNCNDCHNDVCQKCTCNESKKDIPISFLQRN